MSLVHCNLKPIALAIACAATLPLGMTALTADASAQAKAKASPRMHEVTITVDRVRAVNVIDALSKPDFYARVTIDGVRTATTPVQNQVDISPNWKISASVPAGIVKVKVEILDKDVQQDDPIDINRVANKRDLDFTIDTRSCRLSGFAQAYRCGTKVVRAGDEKKSAEISFRASVKK